MNILLLEKVLVREVRIEPLLTTVSTIWRFRFGRYIFDILKVAPFPNCTFRVESKNGRCRKGGINDDFVTSERPVFLVKSLSQG